VFQLLGAPFCWACVDVSCELVDRAATAMPAARNFDLSPASDVTECDLLPVTAGLWHRANPVLAQMPSSAECSATAAAFNVSQYERFTHSADFHFDAGKCYAYSELAGCCKPISLCNGESALPIKHTNAALDLTAPGISCAFSSSASPKETFLSTGECVKLVPGVNVSSCQPESQNLSEALTGSDQPHGSSGEK
jgi:hypothetical protein